jgi:hypothetical protein
MLNLFVDWFTKVEKNKPAYLDKWTLTLGGDSDNPGGYIDIDTKNAIARITFWQSGNFYAEIISIATESTVYQNHDRLQSNDVLEEKLELFFKKLTTMS